jgi:hypothetical protein
VDEDGRIFQLVGWRVWASTYLHVVFTTHLLSRFMNPFSVWETKRRSASQRISCLLRNPEGLCHIYKSPHWPCPQTDESILYPAATTSLERGQDWPRSKEVVVQKIWPVPETVFCVLLMMSVFDTRNT